MNDAKDNIDDTFEADWAKIEGVLSSDAKPLTSNVLDKQIIAAAHCEVATSKKAANIESKAPWWKKLAIPMYACSAFVLSIIVFKSIWQSPVLLNDQTGGEVAVTVNKGEQVNKPLNPEEAQGSSNETEVEIYTGGQLVKSKYSEKDAWATKIVKLAKSGKKDLAEQELKKFKKVYPDYPIEQKLKK